LTVTQYKEVKAFLKWSFSKKKFFGWGNFDERFKEFKRK